MAVTKPVDAGDVIEKAEAGKELSAAEQRAYDKALADAADEKGYVPFRYHGVEMYRIVEAHERTFETEGAAQEYVMRMRVHRNLTGT